MRIKNELNATLQTYGSDLDPHILQAQLAMSGRPTASSIALGQINRIKAEAIKPQRSKCVSWKRPRSVKIASFCNSDHMEQHA